LLIASDEGAAGRARDADLHPRHPELAEALDLWAPPGHGVRGRLRRLRALGPVRFVVLVLLCTARLCSALLWLYVAIVWARL
jgi:hypothetical protein